jgi:hypothetical protein
MLNKINKIHYFRNGFYFIHRKQLDYTIGLFKKAAKTN